MIALALIAATLLTSEGIVELRFGWSPSQDPRQTEVESGQLETGTRILSREYWFRRTVSVGRAKSYWWTDTLRCPAARQVLQKAIELEPPKATIYGPSDPALPPEGVIVSTHGAGYLFEVNALYGNRSGSELKFTASDNTPLAEWVGQSLRTLDPCWSKVRPAHPLL
jgi:hypothetical protein